MWRVIADIGELDPDELVEIVLSGFDGVHRGHQRLIHRAEELASATHLRLVLATCWPPLAGDPAGQLLTTRAERADLLRTLASDATLLEGTLPDSTAGGELDGVIASIERVDCVIGVVTNRFLAAQLARRPEFMMETLVVGVEQEGTPISAANIRALLLAGDVQAAEQQLGRPYALSGVVVQGDRRGRELGFPTANLRVDPVKLIPANGIYAVRARVAGAEYGGAASIGVRPQFGAGGPRLVEVYLLDAQPDLYGQTLEVEFVSWLRAEERFESVEALVAQMHADVARAREVLAATPVAH
jgi:riboflavin kinase / FMN adenylyltransferase